MPWEVVVLCSSATDKAAMYAALHSALDTHAALDLLDIQEVADSWTHAAQWNASEQ